jgi:hypothetical protein
MTIIQQEEAQNPERDPVIAQAIKEHRTLNRRLNKKQKKLKGILRMPCKLWSQRKDKEVLKQEYRDRHKVYPLDECLRNKVRISYLLNQYHRLKGSDKVHHNIPKELSYYKTEVENWYEEQFAWFTNLPD